MKNITKYICICSILLIPFLSITVSANQPPNTPTINGPTTGQIGVEQTYGFCSEDPDGDNITYTIDWDDNTGEHIFGPVSGGKCILLDNTWFEQGTYIIRAKASDGQAESEWGELTINMPRNRAINWFFLRFLQQFPLLEKLLNLL